MLRAAPGSFRVIGRSRCARGRRTPAVPPLRRGAGTCSPARAKAQGARGGRGHLSRVLCLRPPLRTQPREGAGAKRLLPREERVPRWPSPSVAVGEPPASHCSGVPRWPVQPAGSSAPPGTAGLRGRPAGRFSPAPGCERRVCLVAGAGGSRGPVPGEPGCVPPLPARGSPAGGASPSPGWSGKNPRFGRAAAGCAAAEELFVSR